MKTLFIGEKREAMADLAMAIGDPGINSPSTKSGREAFHLKASGRGYIEGEKYIFTWAAGHLFRDKSPSEINPAWGLKCLFKKPQEYCLPELYGAMCKIPNTQGKQNATKKKQLDILKKILNRTDIELIINAADADAEGEAIVRDILTFVLPPKLQGVPVRRFWNTAGWGDPATVRECMAALEEGSANKYVWLDHSQKARSHSDYLVGMKLTKALTDFGGAGGILSGGRVQSFVLHLACEREREIALYEKEGPRLFYSIVGEYEGVSFSHYYEEEEDGKTTIQRQYNNRHDAIAVLEAINSAGKRAKVLFVESKERTTKARPLALSGSGFALEMMKKHKISYGECNEILNFLRASGFTTYPGTNGVYFSQNDAGDVYEGARAASVYFKQSANIEALPETLFNDAKAAKQNHPPLNLTGKLPTEDDLAAWKKAKGEDGSVLTCVQEGFELIAKHILLHFLENDKFIQEKVVIESAGHLFDASGRKPIEQGWRGFMGMEISDSSLGINLSVGDMLAFSSLLLKDGKSKRPVKHTISSILSIMLNPSGYFDYLLSEEDDPKKIRELKRYRTIMKDVTGIGTDRTRKGIMQTVAERGYWTVDKKGAIDVTPLGWEVEAALPPPIKSIATTAQWEIKFEEIRRGEFPYEKFISVVDKNIMQVYIPGIFAHYKRVGFKFPRDASRVETSLMCPLCGAPIVALAHIFVCSKQTYKNGKKGGCAFSLFRQQKKLEATLGEKQLELLLSGVVVKSKNGYGLGLDLKSPYFTQLFLPSGEPVVFGNKSETGAGKGSGNKSSGPSAKTHENGVAETEKTYRLGDVFVYKKQMGKDLTPDEALKVLRGEEISITRMSKKTKSEYFATIWLDKEGKCEVSFG